MLCANGMGLRPRGNGDGSLARDSLHHPGDSGDGVARWDRQQLRDRG